MNGRQAHRMGTLVLSLVMTVIGLTIAFVYRPQGLGVVFGMALFQVVLVISTALPVMKKIRADGADGQTGTDGLEGEASKS
jgi:1,4-dihydroxy-2-naphthoate octaprenyltransferase